MFRPHTDRERAVTERYPDAPKLTSLDQMLDLGAIKPKKACHLIERQPGIDRFATCARRQHRHRHGGNEVLPGRRQGGLGGTTACRCPRVTWSWQANTPEPGLPGGFLEGQTLMGAEGAVIRYRSSARPRWTGFSSRIAATRRSRCPCQASRSRSGTAKPNAIARSAAARRSSAPPWGALPSRSRTMKGISGAGRSNTRRRSPAAEEDSQTSPAATAWAGDPNTPLGRPSGNPPIQRMANQARGSPQASITLPSCSTTPTRQARPLGAFAGKRRAGPEAPEVCVITESSTLDLQGH